MIINLIIIFFIFKIMYTPRLLKERFENLIDFSGKSVIVVGNAKFKLLGSKIDKYDIVIRVNPTFKTNPEDVGKKTDIVHLNYNIRNKNELKFVPKAKNYWSRNSKESIKQLGTKLKGYVKSYNYYNYKKKIYKEWKKNCKNDPTSGMLAIFEALENVPVVHCAGISSYKKSSQDSRSRNDKWHKKNLLKYHCPDYEYEVIQKLKKEGKLIQID